MRYWLWTGDGKTYGPYDAAQLQQFAAEGRIAPDAMICAEGGSTWQPASSAVQVANAPPAPPATPATAPAPPAASGEQSVSLVGPILTTICCCLVGGIVSIVYASKANSAAARGDHSAATEAAKISKRWMIASIIIGSITTFFYFIATMNR